MRPLSRPVKTALVWIGWWLAMIVVTVILLRAQEEGDQAHVVLAYLLVVLGGSAGGGRALGFLLACAGFLLIDYYFQPPYDTLAVGKSMDWVILLAFLATAAVTTQLLSRARSEADQARRRTEEVSSLARLGAETLTAGRADDALAAIAALVRSTLAVRECEIHRWDGRQVVGSVLATASPGSSRLPGTRAELMTRAANAATPKEPDQLVLVPVDEPGLHAILIPLFGHTRIVGVIRIADVLPLRFDPGQTRFLAVLAYYAALGVERVDLAAEAEHAEVLRRADRVRDVLLASLSHDLRTPLTAIKAMAQVGAQKGDSQAGAIEEQADLLSRLVSDLLDWSRIKAGGLPVNTELNTAEDLIGAVARQFTAAGARAPLRTDIDYDRPALVGNFDFVHSFRILNNLVENAARHAPSGTEVELSVRLEAGLLVFRVADRGPGVAVEERERIFEPFYRPIGAPPDAGRAGLGLSIARRLAEAQGGALGYAPRDGGGSVFQLSLPAANLEPSFDVTAS